VPTEPAQKPESLDWLRFLGPVAYRDWSPDSTWISARFWILTAARRRISATIGWTWCTCTWATARPTRWYSRGVCNNDRHDGRPAPDTCNALSEYDGFSVLFQSNAYPVGPEYGITFYGDKGRLFINRNRSEFTPAGKNAQPVRQQTPGDITTAHVRNFLDCCKSRKRPTADAAIAAISILPPLLAVQSYEEQRRLRFDPVRLEVLPL
jgi:predicted dehydrogenase